MLKVVGIYHASICDLTIDEYVPLSFRTQLPANIEPLYWRTGDIQRNIFELSVNRNGGEVYGSTLVSSVEQITSENQNFYADPSVSLGLPIVDISAIDSRTIAIDHISPFRIIKTNDSINVLFNESNNSKSCMKCGRVSFLIEDEFLVGVRFGPLTKDELETFSIWEKYR